MKTRMSSMILAAVTVAVSIAGSARAECIIAENFDYGGRTGTVQNGDLLKFFPKEQMGLTGEANAKREFNDAKWKGILSSVDIKGACTAALYGPWGHYNVTKATPQLGPDYNDKTTGVGCYCK